MKKKSALHHSNSIKRTKQSRMDPSLKAALIFLLPTLIIRILGAIFGFSWVGCILQLLLSVGCGYHAASIYHESIRKMFPKGRPKEAVRKGAAAGITLGILVWVIMIILTLLAGSLLPVSLGFMFGGISVIVIGPLNIIGGLFLGALGGKILASMKR